MSAVKLLALAFTSSITESRSAAAEELSETVSRCRLHSPHGIEQVLWLADRRSRRAGRPPADGDDAA